MGRVLVVFNAALAVLFAAAFALLTLAPERVERHARDQIVQRIASAAAERYPALASSAWQAAAAKALRSRADELRTLRDSPVVDELVAVLASLCKHDCPDRQSMAGRVRGWLSERVGAYEHALGRVREWAQDRYNRFFAELIADLQIFTASNALLCLLAAVASRLANGTRRSVLVLSAILSASALIAASLYMFAQNWLQTLLFADYVGYGYLVWVALIGSLLADVAFNKGRVLQGLGHAVSGLADST